MDTNYSSDYGSTGAAMFGGLWMFFWLVLAIASIAGLWKMFNKAGHSGLKALVPVYNVYILLKIAGRPGWWLILMFIPVVNIIVSLIWSIDLAKAYGRSALFGVAALWLFSAVGYLLLGFGPDKYVGPAPHKKV